MSVKQWAQFFFPIESTPELYIARGISGNENIVLEPTQWHQAHSQLTI